jgi:hypothetical protein
MLGRYAYCHHYSGHPGNNAPSNHHALAVPCLQGYGEASLSSLVPLWNTKYGMLWQLSGGSLDYASDLDSEALSEVDK